MADQVDTVETTGPRPDWLNPRFLTLTAIALVGAACHVVPPLPNFSPLFALTLFGGAYFSNRVVAVLLPLAAMFLGDLVIGYSGHAMQTLQLMPFVYAGFLLTALLGMWLRRRQQSVVAITAATLASSVLFFIISNLGFWVVFGPHTLAGLVKCYIEAIPFFRNTLASNAAFTLLFFGGFALAQRLIISLREQPALAAVPQRSSP